uniref:HAT C-terminal dimerisation domain-containing protein n=1 Tax=Latimeria chalumnae TaxID=7897 RepID=H3AGH1_LATCH
MINGAIAPHFREKLVEVMRNSPYSLFTDGSNNTGREKMNLLTGRMFDINTQRVESRLFDDCATAAVIFDKTDQALDTHSIPWANYVGFGVDNTSIGLRKRNSIMTRMKENNAACYFMGCPCHLIHNVVCKSASSFKQLFVFDVDLFYYFNKSTMRKSMLVEFSEFCDVKHRQVIKHVSTHWLNLETAVQQNLYVCPALKSYFLSNSESLPHFRVYFLFYNAVLPVFTTLNKYLQREDPCIFAAHDQIQDFVKRVLGKFISIRNIREAKYVENVQFEGEENQPEDEELFFGLVINKRLPKGDIEPTQRSMFFKAVQQFYVAAITEPIAKLHLDDSVFKHSRFLDFQRDKRTFTDVESFVNTYSDLLLASPQDREKLQEEFVDYQLLGHIDITESIWVDVIWGHLSSLKMADGSLKFGRISKVAKAVLVLPHSNAGEERVFSMVRRNKSSFRSSLKVDGTLASLITIKLANKEQCYNFEPTEEVLTKAK